MQRPVDDLRDQYLVVVGPVVAHHWPQWVRSAADTRLAGFHTLDERRQQALDGSALEQLSRDGHLLPAYMVLASLSRFRDLIERMNRRRAAGR